MGPPRNVPYTKTMSSRVAAWTAVVCTLLFGGAIARADRKPVAVIDLTDTQAGDELARNLGNVLNTHDQLRPVNDPDMPAALMGQIADEDFKAIAEARAAKQKAEEQLSPGSPLFDFSNANKNASEAQDKLLTTAPTPAAVALYAELAFVVGHAQLGLRHPELAAQAFTLAHHLDPSFVPDGGRWLPEVVQAFDRARAASLVMGKIQVIGTGRVFIDGTEVGTSPAWFDVTSGDHVVWLTGPERYPVARRVTVVAEQKVVVEIEDAAATKATKVKRARLALKQAPDAAARAVAITRLAGLLDVHDAVLLTSSNGKTIYQTWRDQAPGFSALRELRKERPIELLAPLAPPPILKVDKPPDPPPKKIVIIPEGPWYKRGRYQAGMIATGITIIVGIVLVKSIDRHVTNDPDAGFLLRGPRP